MEMECKIRRMSPLVAFIVLTLILGYPRFYGTELPMALLIIPFYFAGFGRFFLAQGYFSIVLLFLFSMWLFVGLFAFVNGDGVDRDIIFHVIVLVKILLNIFFGYVVYQVVRGRPSVLVIWLIFQSVIIVTSMLSGEVYALMLGFISPRSAEVFQHIYGLRALGFGIFHVDGALTIVLALFFSILLARAKFVNGLLLVLLLPLSMAVARSAIIAYAIMSVFRKGWVFKVFLVFALLLMVVLSFYVESGPLFEATEIFRNLFQSGVLQSNSVDGLLEMYVFPDNINDWLFGHGKYYSGGGEALEFYRGTDVGYLRVIYFSGLGSVFIFILLNIFFLFPLIFSRNYPGIVEARLFAFSLIIIFLVINFKGLQGVSVFAMALYMHYFSLRHSKMRVS